MGRIEKEKSTIKLMINLYCKKKHKTNGTYEELCEECTDLLEYANKRLSLCKFGEDKSSCYRCQIHCYKKDMRQKVKEVMKFSGPRIVIYDPIELVRHMFK